MDSKEPTIVFWVAPEVEGFVDFDAAHRATVEDITDDLVERAALALRNADADDHGWPSIDSLSDNDDRGASEYRRQATIALKAVFASG